MTQITTKTLYDRDFALWVEETVTKLKEREFDRVDWENVIEEIESLSKRDKRELKNRLITLFEHILKRNYVPLPDCYRGWEVTIKRTQYQLRDIIADSPSLGNLLQEIARDCYYEALANMQIEYEANFPSLYPFSDDVDSLLTEEFWRRS
jgi:hypothetical protein